MSDLKARVGRAAAELAEDGMVVGLGTGSTAAHAIRRLGERVRDERLRLRGIPTSEASARLAAECGLTLVSFDEAPRIDLTIDGADEFDPALNLTKGGGGALLREKVVAAASALVVIITDPTKRVERLGESFPLPVEVVPFAWRPVEAAARRLGAEPRRREDPAGKPFVTDNGNWILDLRFAGGIADPAALEAELDTVPGMVESGLFVGLASRVLVGHPDRIETIERR